MSDSAHPETGVEGPRPPAWRSSIRPVLSTLLLTSRFLPVWLATIALLVVTAIVAPEALQSTSWAFVLPYMTVLAVAAIGQMLVIMQAGIDLSIPGVMFLGGNLVLGVSHHSDSRLALGILACIGLGMLVGLANGLFVGILRLNPLIVTLAVGTIVLAFGSRYARGVSFESAVPPALSSWALQKPLGISWVFWVGVTADDPRRALLSLHGPGATLPGGRRQLAGCLDGRHPRANSRRLRLHGGGSPVRGRRRPARQRARIDRFRLRWRLPARADRGSRDCRSVPCWRPCERHLDLGCSARTHAPARRYCSCSASRRRCSSSSSELRSSPE